MKGINLYILIHRPTESWLKSTIESLKKRGLLKD
uniref:Uncharacterized protein n=1 Tax=Lepeophtheirus salmonis TaxID=72036 RepID=A0A0K2V569_LEPSM